MSVTKQDVHRLQQENALLRERVAELEAREPVKVEVPVERIVYVDKEVPGPERIVYVDRVKEVPVDRVITQRVEIPGPERVVYRDRIKEVPVERIVYKQRPQDAERIAFLEAELDVARRDRGLG